MPTRRNRKTGLVAPMLPALLVSALFSCASTPSGAAPPAPNGAASASPSLGPANSEMTAIVGEAKATQQRPQYVVVGIMDHDLYDYYCHVAETDGGMAALMNKTNVFPGFGFLFNLYRGASSEYMPNVRSFHSAVDSKSGDAVAINNRSEILFRSGTVYKWNGKSVVYVRRTAGPPFPIASGAAQGTRRLFIAPDALGMNDAGVVVGDSWCGLYSCAPGGGSALFMEETPPIADNGAGTDAPAGADDVPNAEEVAEAVRAMRHQVQGSPAVGRGYPGRGSNRGGTATGPPRRPYLEAQDELHMTICNAAYRLLPQGPSKVIFPSASDDFLVQHLDLFSSRGGLDAFTSYMARVNNKGHIIARTAMIPDERTNGPLVDSPYLFGLGDQFTTLDAALPLLVKTNDTLPAAPESTSKNATAGAVPGALVPIPWGKGLADSGAEFLPRDLNNQDHLAGIVVPQERLVDTLAEIAGKPRPHPALLAKNAALWNGRMTLLRGPVNSVWTEAWGLNSRDQVVGTCVVPTGKDQSTGRATLWRDGKVYDLNSCIPPASGWSLVDARAINDKGEIVGLGDYQGQRYSFLLVPVAGQAVSPGDNPQSDPAGSAAFASKP